MFLQVCVILFTGGSTWPGTPPWDQLHPLGPGTHPPTPGTPPRTRYTPKTRHTPWDQVHPPGPGRYGLHVGSTHPTGMQSCIHGVFLPPHSLCQCLYSLYFNGICHYIVFFKNYTDVLLKSILKMSVCCNFAVVACHKEFFKVKCRY